MIIGLTGTFGAGKGAVVAHLVKNFGFKHYSASGFLTEVIRERGMPLNRDSMIAVANELRASHGPSYIVETLFARAEREGGKTIIESLRAPAEVKKIKSLGGFVIGIDAAPQIRYERSLLRNSVKDDVSYEKWAEQELQESSSEDPTKQNIPKALKLADCVIINNGTIEQLYAEIDRVMASLQASSSEK